MSTRMSMEDQLRQALRHDAAPPDFAAKVLARAGYTAWWRRRVTLAMAAGLVVAALIPPGVSEYQRREARQTAEQLQSALAITGLQLRHVNEKIQRNTRHKI